MKRRNFLKLAIAASVLAAKARGAGDMVSSPERNATGFRVGAQQDRHGEELLVMGGRFDLKVSSRDTGGDLCIYDTTRLAKGGPALHRHHFQDEWFYVVRGEFIVRVGEDTLSLHRGDSAFAPRKIPHAFAKVSDGEGQMLVLFQPAGSMEDFFLQMSKLGKEILKNQEVVLKRLWEEHGMEVVGPPLKF
ncbi:MAG TPA: cupin domain-containing protein [Candidatus Sulfopaludibacter sp.]|nr:cupin domain-containing protein [Candidatus Sulfopaludibacter sp.]